MEYNKEKNPHLYDNCSHCENDYDLTPDNTALRKFNKQSECNYLYTVCPHCEGHSQIFCGEETTDEVIKAGISVVEEDYADQEEYQIWLEVNEIKLIEPQEISSRQERFLGYFKYLIDNDLIDFVKDKFI